MTTLSRVNDRKGQKRERNATLSRTSLKSRFSLDGLLTSSPKELAEILIDPGILKDRSTESCACGRSSSKLETREAHCSWRCTKCRKCVSVLAEDQDLFPDRLPLRTFAGGLWLFCSPLHLSLDKAGLILGVDNRIEIGGLGEDVELDEIAFRSKTVGDNVVWIRFMENQSKPKSPLPELILGQREKFARSKLNPIHRSTKEPPTKTQLTDSQHILSDV